MEIKMHAARAHDYGAPGALVYEEAPWPKPEAGQVLVRIKSAGVNPADWKYLSGAFKQFMPLQFPWIPGLEAAGVVEALGPQAASFSIGDPVFGRISNSYAEFALSSAGELQPKPAELSFDQAAGVPIGASTAWMVVNTVHVQPGQRVVVLGAAGGVGIYVVQLAHHLGAHVISVSSAENREFVRSLGANEVIDYQSAPFESQVKDADVVIDLVGGDLPERSLKVLHPGGVFITIGTRVQADFGQAERIRTLSSPRSSAEDFKHITEQFVAQGIIKPVVGKIFPLQAADQALAMSQAGHGRGRITIHVAD